MSVHLQLAPAMERLSAVTDAQAAALATERTKKRKQPRAPRLQLIGVERVTLSDHP